MKIPVIFYSFVKFFIVLSFTSLNACHSMLLYRYQQTNYLTPLASKPGLKHVAVVAWQTDVPEYLTEALLEIGADLIKLRSNYIVHELATYDNAPLALCHQLPEISGVLALRPLAYQSSSAKIDLTVSLEMLSCHDGALLFEVVGQHSHHQENQKLRHLKANYATRVDPKAAQDIPGIFVLLQQLVKALPNPQLTDDEMLEKIELGHLLGLPAKTTLFSQRRLL